MTSPSNPHTSPSGNGGEYYRPGSGDRRSTAGSPPPIDIRAQFLADLRRLGDPHNPHHHPLASHHLSNLQHHRPSSPIGVADESSSSPEDGSTTPNNGHDLSSKSPMAESLPPRKRRLSGSITEVGSNGKLGSSGRYFQVLPNCIFDKMYSKLNTSINDLIKILESPRNFDDYRIRLINSCLFRFEWSSWHAPGWQPTSPSHGHTGQLTHNQRSPWPSTPS